MLFRSNDTATTEIYTLSYTTLFRSVIAVLASAIQLGERPPALELTGMALIGVALALLGWIGVRRDRAALGA